MRLLAIVLSMLLCLGSLCSAQAPEANNLLKPAGSLSAWSTEPGTASAPEVTCTGDTLIAALAGTGSGQGSVYQVVSGLKAGTVYTLRFEARAAGACQIRVSAGPAGKPWMDWQGVEIGTEWKQYERALRAVDGSEIQAPEFLISEGTTLRIRSVSLAEGGTLPAAPVAQPAKRTTPKSASASRPTGRTGSGASPKAQPDRPAENEYFRASSASTISLEAYRATNSKFSQTSPDGMWRWEEDPGRANGYARAVSASDGRIVQLPLSVYTLRLGYGRWLPGGHVLLSSESGAEVRSYDLDQGGKASSLTPPGEKWQYASVSPDGRLVAFQATSGMLTIADLKQPTRRLVTNTRVSDIAADSFNVNKLHWAEDGKSVLASGRRGQANALVCLQVRVSEKPGAGGSEPIGPVSAGPAELASPQDESCLAGIRLGDSLDAVRKLYGPGQTLKIENRTTLLYRDPNTKAALVVEEGSSGVIASIVIGAGDYPGAPVAASSFATATAARGVRLGSTSGDVIERYGARAPGGGANAWTYTVGATRLVFKVERGAVTTIELHGTQGTAAGAASAGSSPPAGEAKAPAGKTETALAGIRLGDRPESAGSKYGARTPLVLGDFTMRSWRDPSDTAVLNAKDRDGRVFMIGIHAVRGATEVQQASAPFAKAATARGIALGSADADVRRAYGPKEVSGADRNELVYELDGARLTFTIKQGVVAGIDLEASASAPAGGQASAPSGAKTPAGYPNLRALVGQPREAVEKVLGAPIRTVASGAYSQHELLANGPAYHYAAPTPPHAKQIIAGYPKARAVFIFACEKRISPEPVQKWTRQILADFGLVVPAGFALPEENGRALAEVKTVDPLLPGVIVKINSYDDYVDIVTIAPGK